MKRKTCIICKAKLKPVQHLFCKNECYLIGVEEQNKKDAYIKRERNILKDMIEITELETELLYAKKQNIILKESIGFDSPFTANYKDKVPYNLVD